MHESESTVSFAPLSRWQRGLYFVTPESGNTTALRALVDEALAGGAVLLQYRSKSKDRALRHAQATALREIACTHCVPFIVNDDVALAQSVAADGVHLGREDADIATARELLGSESIIGASCYASIDAARRAAAAGASYFAFGALFPSRTKPQAAHAPLELFRQAADLGLPRVAIGGITLDNAGVVIAAGADLVAVVSALADVPDPRAAAARLSALFAPTGPPP